MFHVYNTAGLGLPADHMIVANHQALAEKPNKSASVTEKKQKAATRGALSPKAAEKNSIQK